VTYLPGTFESIASGLFRGDAGSPVPKPSLAAFRFPFVVKPAAGGSLAWGIAPRRGAAVAIQQRSGGRWFTVARVRPRRSGEFRAGLDRGSGRYRARQGRRLSPAWRR
jgi:hypothetical protein